MSTSNQASADRGTSETVRNNAVIRRFVEAVQNDQDWAAYDELNDPVSVNRSAPPGVPPHREGGKMYLQALPAAYPGARLTINDMIAEGEQEVTKRPSSAPTRLSSPACRRRAHARHPSVRRHHARP